MPLDDIAAALHRAESVLRKRPGAGRGPDLPATVTWTGDLRTVSRHPSGVEVATDMPGELGGGAAHPAPGWLLRVALASCVATRIAMLCATDGIALDVLEVEASSGSDARGLFGIDDANGEPVTAGPSGVSLQVRIGARGVTADRLQALVRAANRSSPVTSALETALPVALHIELAPSRNPAELPGA